MAGYAVPLFKALEILPALRPMPDFCAINAAVLACSLAAAS